MQLEEQLLARGPCSAVPVCSGTQVLRVHTHDQAVAGRKSIVVSISSYSTGESAGTCCSPGQEVQTIRVAVERRELVSQNCQGLLGLLGLDRFEELLLSDGELDRLKRQGRLIRMRGRVCPGLSEERTGREETHLQIDGRIDGQTFKKLFDVDPSALENSPSELADGGRLEGEPRLGLQGLCSSPAHRHQAVSFARRSRIQGKAQESRTCSPCPQKLAWPIAQTRADRGCCPSRAAQSLHRLHTPSRPVSSRVYRHRLRSSSGRCLVGPQPRRGRYRSNVHWSSRRSVRSPNARQGDRPLVALES